MRFSKWLLAVTFLAYLSLIGCKRSGASQIQQDGQNTNAFGGFVCKPIKSLLDY